MAGTKLPLLAEMAGILSPVFASAGVPDADSWGERATLTLAEYFGGSSLYIPRNTVSQRERRDAAIRAGHDGTSQSVTRLAREHGITDVYVYRILAKRAPKAS